MNPVRRLMRRYSGIAVSAAFAGALIAGCDHAQERAELPSAIKLANSFCKAGAHQLGISLKNAPNVYRDVRYSPDDAKYMPSPTAVPCYFTAQNSNGRNVEKPVSFFMTNDGTAHLLEDAKTKLELDL